MFCTTLVRRYIASLPAGTIFTTADCLIFGSRTAVDQALWREVKWTYIERLARGMFVRAVDRNKEYSASEIAQKKTTAFGKILFSNSAKIAEQLGLKVFENTIDLFSINKSKCKFDYFGGTIRFGSMSGKMEKLGQDKTGDIIRALWYLGKGRATIPDIIKVLAPLNRNDINHIIEKSALMPAWLLKKIRHVIGRYWRVYAATRHNHSQGERIAPENKT